MDDPASIVFSPACHSPFSPLLSARLPYRLGHRLSPRRSYRPGARFPSSAWLVLLLAGAIGWGAPNAFGADPVPKAKAESKSDAKSGAAAQPDPAAAPPPKGFDQPQVLRRCLVFTVKNIRDRQADVDHEDWVVLNVENRCGTSIFNLQVELVLVDTRGRAYGKQFWVVGQGERLGPGSKWEDTVAVPDPDNRVPRAWTVRVLRADVPGKPRPKVEAPKDWR